VVDPGFCTHESELPVFDALHCARDWNEQFTASPAWRSFRHHFPFDPVFRLDPAALAEAVKAQSAATITRAYRMKISVSWLPFGKEAAN
jgi:hypothetical protein